MLRALLNCTSREPPSPLGPVWSARTTIVDLQKTKTSMRMATTVVDGKFMEKFYRCDHGSIVQKNTFNDTNYYRNGPSKHMFEIVSSVGTQLI